MRYRLTYSKRQRHAQVLTPPALADLLVRSIGGSPGASWLELGCGTGRIVDACHRVAAPSQYVGVELDARFLEQCAAPPSVQLRQADVLRPRALAEALGNQLFDRVCANPPYGMAALRSESQVRLAELCPGIAQVKNWVQLDVYFILESLSRLRCPGEAAFIVGAPVAQDIRLRAFRKALCEQASEIECYELPARAFERAAEVQAYLLIARFASSKSCKVTVGRLQDGTDSLDTAVRISVDAAIDRLDFAHHHFVKLDSKLRGVAGCMSLRDLGAVVVRGSRTRAQFESMGVEHFHTTDFPRGTSEFAFGESRDHGFNAACAGDVLLPRVGTRCLDRQGVVASGRRHFTEAVYRLRVPKSQSRRVVEWVTGELGSVWRQAAAKGSCAKHVTVKSLLEMPVLRRGERLGV